MPRATVTRVLERAGPNRLALLEPPPVVQRYEWPAAGDLLHLDIKPCVASTAIGRSAPVGDEYAHVAIDDATRVAYVEVRRSQRQRACAALLTNALRWFRRRGITVRRLLTDNGNGYRARQSLVRTGGLALSHSSRRLEWTD